MVARENRYRKDRYWYDRFRKYQWWRCGVCVWVTAALVACAPHDTSRVDASPFTDVQVLIPSDSGRVLGATLSLPAGAPASVRTTPAPAVLLIGGSGPQDRDGPRADLPTYAPLRQLAEFLVREGFAVLRVDDRGMGESTGSFVGSTTRDFAADAERAVAWLRRRVEVDSTQVTLLGHSEGALVALLVAARDQQLQTLVLMGAPSRTGRDVARWQRATLVAGDPATWPSSERSSILASAERDAERAAERDPWLRTWFALDPRAIAHNVPTPTLLLHGETDRQVPSAQADELADALRDGGATDVSVRRFPSTNHLFLEDDFGDPRAYGQLATHTIRGDVLREILAWLRAHSTR